MLFVGLQCMCPRVWSNNDVTRNIGIAQSSMRRLRQFKICDAVIDHVNSCIVIITAMQKLTIAPSQRLRVSDDGFDASRFK